MKTAPFLPIVLSALVLSLPACGDQEKPETPDTPSNQTPATASKGESSPEEADYLRFTEEEGGNARLETVITRFTGHDGVTVDLIAVVHIADAEYYEELNTLFHNYDSLLFEAVAPKDYRPTPGHESGLSSIQRMMKDFLDLEFQLDAIDYSPDNFVHADLTPLRMFELMEEKGESLLTIMLQQMLAGMKMVYSSEEAMKEAEALNVGVLVSLFSKDRAPIMKRLLGKQFDQMERMAAGMEKNLKGEESILLVERNKAALEVMEEVMAVGNRRLGIFYGAAHMPDLGRRLVEDYGFKELGSTWLTAWNIEGSPTPEGAD